MLVAQGGAYAGWSLYLHEGRPAYCYNFFGLQRFKIHGEQPVPAGEHQIRMEFAYDGGGLGNGGDVTLYVDGDKVGEGRGAHCANALLRDETLDLGRDSATPANDDHTARQRLHRSGALGPNRHRRRGRGPRPPDQPGRAPAYRDGAPVAGFAPRSAHSAPASAARAILPVAPSSAPADSSAAAAFATRRPVSPPARRSETEARSAAVVGRQLVAHVEADRAVGRQLEPLVVGRVHLDVEADRHAGQPAGHACGRAGGQAAAGELVELEVDR